VTADIPSGQGPRVLVLGLGNILLSDEGVGARLAARLARDFSFDGNVEVIDGGTSGMELLEPIAECDVLIVVDAVKTGKTPGTLVRLTGNAVPAFFMNKVSPHQVALSDVLASLRLTGEYPGEVVIHGIEPESLATGLELTHTVGARRDELLGNVLEELERLGHRPRRFTPRCSAA